LFAYEIYKISKKDILLISFLDILYISRLLAKKNIF